MPGVKLPDAVKVYVVQAVACFDSPAVVAEAVNREFGLKIPRQQVEKYDPTKRAGRDLSPKLRAIFEATRKGFIENTANIGWSHRATRLRAIQRVGERAESMGNLALTLQAAEQAAKECGDAYSNRHKHEHTGKDGGPIETVELTEAELRERLKERGLPTRIFDQ